MSTIMKAGDIITPSEIQTKRTSPLSSASNQATDEAEDNSSCDKESSTESSPSDLKKRLQHLTSTYEVTRFGNRVCKKRDFDLQAVENCIKEKEEKEDKTQRVFSSRSQDARARRRAKIRHSSDSDSESKYNSDHSCMSNTENPRDYPVNSSMLRVPSANASESLSSRSWFRNSAAEYAECTRKVNSAKEGSHHSSSFENRQNVSENRINFSPVPPLPLSNARPTKFGGYRPPSGIIFKNLSSGSESESINDAICNVPRSQFDIPVVNTELPSPVAKTSQEQQILPVLSAKSEQDRRISSTRSRSAYSTPGGRTREELCRTPINFSLQQEHRVDDVGVIENSFNAFVEQVVPNFEENLSNRDEISENDCLSNLHQTSRESDLVKSTNRSPVEDPIATNNYPSFHRSRSTRTVFSCPPTATASGPQTNGRNFVMRNSVRFGSDGHNTPYMPTLSPNHEGATSHRSASAQQSERRPSFLGAKLIDELGAIVQDNSSARDVDQDQATVEIPMLPLCSENTSYSTTARSKEYSESRPLENRTSTHHTPLSSASVQSSNKSSGNKENVSTTNREIPTKNDGTHQFHDFGLSVPNVNSAKGSISSRTLHQPKESEPKESCRQSNHSRTVDSNGSMSSDRSKASRQMASSSRKASSAGTNVSRKEEIMQMEYPGVSNMLDVPFIPTMMSLQETHRPNSTDMSGRSASYGDMNFPQTIESPYSATSSGESSFVQRTKILDMIRSMSISMMEPEQNPSNHTHRTSYSSEEEAYDASAFEYNLAYPVFVRDQSPLAVVNEESETRFTENGSESAIATKQSSVSLSSCRDQSKTDTAHLRVDGAQIRDSSAKETFNFCNEEVGETKGASLFSARTDEECDNSTVVTYKTQLERNTETLSQRTPDQSDDSSECSSSVESTSALSHKDVQSDMATPVISRRSSNRMSTHKILEANSSRSATKSEDINYINEISSNRSVDKEDSKVIMASSNEQESQSTRSRSIRDMQMSCTNVISIDSTVKSNRSNREERSSPNELNYSWSTKSTKEEEETQVSARKVKRNEPQANGQDPAKFVQSENVILAFRKGHESSTFPPKVSSSTSKLLSVSDSTKESPHLKRKSQDRFPFTISEKASVNSTRLNVPAEKEESRNGDKTVTKSLETFYTLNLHPSITRLANEGFEQTPAEIVGCLSYSENHHRRKNLMPKMRRFVRKFSTKLKSSRKRNLRENTNTKASAEVLYTNRECQNSSQAETCSDDSSSLEESQWVVPDSAKTKLSAISSGKSLKKKLNLENLAVSPPHRRYDCDDLWVKELKEKRPSSSHAGIPKMSSKERFFAFASRSSSNILIRDAKVPSKTDESHERSRSKSSLCKKENQVENFKEGSPVSYRKSETSEKYLDEPHSSRKNGCHCLTFFRILTCTFTDPNRKHVTSLIRDSALKRKKSRVSLKKRKS